jgi:hypothetical protein
MQNLGWILLAIWLIATGLVSLLGISEDQVQRQSRDALAGLLADCKRAVAIAERQLPGFGRHPGGVGSGSRGFAIIETIAIPF